MILKWVRKKLLKIYGIYSKRLANKLILTLSIVVSIFIIAVIMISYLQTIDILSKDYIEKSKAILKLTGQSVDSYVQQIDDLSLTLRRDEGSRMINILIEKSGDYQDEKYIQNKIQDLFNSRQDICEVRFYIPSDNKSYSISRKLANVNVADDPVDQTEKWYEEATSGRYFRYIGPGPISGAALGSGEDSETFFTFHRALININDQSTLAVVSISFDHSLLEEINWNEGSRDGELLCIFGKDKQFFYCSDADLEDAVRTAGLPEDINLKLLNGSFLTRINGNEYQAVYDISEEFGWVTMKLIPVDILDKKPREVRNLNLLLGGICIFLLVAVVGFITNVITRSLNRLSRQMEKVGKGNFKIKAEVRGNDETARLAEKFNLMVEQINELVNEQYVSKLNEKTAQIKALEAQINPHFLYNSLQAISAKTILSGNKEISRLIEALANSFRYCIKGGDMVNIGSEIRHINNYLLLHEARFGDRLSVDMVIDNKIEDALIPKLSIHTLVENSIKHSLEKFSGSLTIKVRTFIENDKIIIEVADTGPGMSQDKLREIRNELNDRNWLEKINERIGLINLNARLKLIYDGEAELEIVESSPGGTRISMAIPMKGKGRQ